MVRTTNRDEPASRYVALTAFAFLITPGCAGESSPSPMTDAGVEAGDAGGGPDAGMPGLCATYPHGSANRAEMLGGTVTRPAANPDGWLMFFKSILVQSDGTYATIGIFPDTATSAPTYYGFQSGQTQAVLIPGPTGTVNMQVCSVTSQQCSVGQPNGVITGDQNCMLVIAADKPFHAGP